MAKDILKELNMGSRDEAVRFLKSLWSEKPMPCPLCTGRLEHLHKKAKKSNSNWKCSNCGTIFRAVNILLDLPER